MCARVCASSCPSPMQDLRVTLYPGVSHKHLKRPQDRVNHLASRTDNLVYIGKSVRATSPARCMGMQTAWCMPVHVIEDQVVIVSGFEGRDGGDGGLKSGPLRLTARCDRTAVRLNETCAPHGLFHVRTEFMGTVPTARTHS